MSVNVTSNQKWMLREGTLYANVGPDGIVVFEKHPDPTLSRLPVLNGPARAVQDTIRRWASLHNDGVTYFLPSVSHASGQAQAVDALVWWRKFLSKHMPSLQNPENEGKSRENGPTMS